MKIFTFIFSILFISLNSMAVDIIGHFNLQSYGKYYPYHSNGTLNVNFDFEVQGGPINKNFTIGFYLSSDMIIDNSDFLIDTFPINSVNTGSSAFPDQFGQPAPYQIKSLLTIPFIPKNTTVFFGVYLDYQNEISETNENNNSGTINMAPIKITGNVGITLTINNKTITIAPNPVIKSTTIDISGIEKKNISLKVMDITGKIVFKRQDVKFPYVWNRGNLKNGMYLLILERNNQAIIRKKIILQ